MMLLSIRTWLIKIIAGNMTVLMNANIEYSPLQEPLIKVTGKNTALLINLHIGARIKISPFKQRIRMKPLAPLQNSRFGKVTEVRSPLISFKEACELTGLSLEQLRGALKANDAPSKVFQNYSKRKSVTYYKKDEFLKWWNAYKERA